MKKQEKTTKKEFFMEFMKYVFIAWVLVASFYYLLVGVLPKFGYMISFAYGHSMEPSIGYFEITIYELFKPSYIGTPFIISNTKFLNYTIENNSIVLIETGTVYYTHRMIGRCHVTAEYLNESFEYDGIITKGDNAKEKDTGCIPLAYVRGVLIAHLRII